MKRLLVILLLAAGAAACQPSEPPPPVECKSLDCQQPPAQEWRDRLADGIAP